MFYLTYVHDKTFNQRDDKTFNQRDDKTSNQRGDYMSMLLMVQAMKVNVGNPARKLVLVKLADNANDEGVCFPSYKTIAKHSEMDRRSVMRHMKRLEEEGFLKVQKRRDPLSKTNRSNVYVLNLTAKLHEQELAEQAERAQKIQLEQTHTVSTTPSDNLSPPPSDNLSPPLVTDCHHPSDNLSPITSHLTSKIESNKNNTVDLDQDLISKDETDVLDYLNENRSAVLGQIGLKTRDFKSTDSNIKPIRTLLKMKYSVDELKLVIDYLLVEWSAKAIMRKYLTPQSMFRVGKFDAKINEATFWDENGRPDESQPGGVNPDNHRHDHSWADGLQFDQHGIDGLEVRS